MTSWLDEYESRGVVDPLEGETFFANSVCGTINQCTVKNKVPKTEDSIVLKEADYLLYDLTTGVLFW